MDNWTIKLQHRITELWVVNPDWRYGQALFNGLQDLYPQRANEIRGTDADPFHENNRTRAFWEALAKLPPVL